MEFARLARAALVAVLFVCACEALARRAGFLDPTVIDDPYLGLPGSGPLYRPARAQDGAAWFERSPNKESYRPERFPRDKDPAEYRVFCIGGSSVRSIAFVEPDASFPRLIEIYLEALLPGRVPRVVNAGGGGAGSIQNLEVLREVLDHEPDLIVVYPEGGEKNYIPPSPQGVLARRDDTSALRVGARRLLARLRVYHAVRLAFQGLLPRARGGDARLSAFSAFAMYATSRAFAKDSFTRLFELKADRPPVLMRHVIPAEEVALAQARLRKNLAAMAECAAGRGVPLLFVQPQRNLKSSFYLRFHIDPDELRPDALEEWRAAYAAGLAAKRAGRHEQALAHLSAVRACYVEDRDEILAFYLAECLEALGRKDEALEEYARPYRRHPLHDLLREVAAAQGVPLVDPFPALVEAAAGGAPGYDLFIDSFHPAAETNRIIARAVVEALARHGLAPGLVQLDGAALAAAERAVAEVVARAAPPPHTLMLRAILARDFAEAARIGRAIPEAQLVGDPRRGVPGEMVVEPLYLGWALARLGRWQEARALHAQLSATWGRRGARLPPLDTDEAMIRNVFSGDVFAWF
ncbi:MAG: hypothetical protein HY812_09875 [Planctomycetes bacterium]|nr:hypothetical protein [Planctomycetota bacterium]